MDHSPIDRLDRAAERILKILKEYNLNCVGVLNTPGYMKKFGFLSKECYSHEFKMLHDMAKHRDEIIASKECNI